jgi:hypothetical protein
MMTDQKFLESITESFKKFISAGSSASTMKLKPLHGAIAKDIADRLGEDYEIKSQGYGNGKEANVMGAYTDKNVDITIYDKRSDSDKPIAGISVKFVMQNYKQNSKNYFHDMIGETANLRSAGIQYFNVFISLDTLPYYKDDKTRGTKIIHHWEKVTQHDMDKYINKRNKKFVQRRYFGDDSEHVCAGIKEFLEIQKKYGGDFYAALGWENKDYQYQLDLAKDIYNAGAEKLISWNANHIAKYGSKLEGVKSCGNKEKILKGDCKVVSNNFRVLSLNGNDISEFDPNWRG